MCRLPSQGTPGRIRVSSSGSRLPGSSKTRGDSAAGQFLQLVLCGLERLPDRLAQDEDLTQAAVHGLAERTELGLEARRRNLLRHIDRVLEGLEPGIGLQELRRDRPLHAGNIEGDIGKLPLPIGLGDELDEFPGLGLELRVAGDADEIHRPACAHPAAPAGSRQEEGADVLQHTGVALFDLGPVPGAVDVHGHLLLPEEFPQQVGLGGERRDAGVIEVFDILHALDDLRIRQNPLAVRAPVRPEGQDRRGACTH